MRAGHWEPGTLLSAHTASSQHTPHPPQSSPASPSPRAGAEMGPGSHGGSGCLSLPMLGAPKGAQVPFWKSKEGLSCFSSMGCQDRALRVCREVSLTRGMWWFRVRGAEAGTVGFCSGAQQCQKTPGLGVWVGNWSHWVTGAECLDAMVRV